MGLARSADGAAAFGDEGGGDGRLPIGDRQVKGGRSLGSSRDAWVAEGNADRKIWSGEGNEGVRVAVDGRFEPCAVTCPCVAVDLGGAATVTVWCQIEGAYGVGVPVGAGLLKERPD